MIEKAGFKDLKIAFYNDTRGNRVGMWQIYIPRKYHTKLLNEIKPRNLVKYNENALAGIRISERTSKSAIP